MSHTSELRWLKKLFGARIKALEKATVVAAKGMNKRLKGMNEFRAQLERQEGTFLTKSEYFVWHDRVDEDLRGLRESRATMEGKASQGAVNTATIIAVAGLSLSLLNILLWYVIR